MTFWNQPLPHADVADSVSAKQLASARAELSAAPWRSYSLAVTGRYRFVSIEEVRSDLIETVVEIARKTCGADLRLVAGRWLSFGHRDYALSEDDERHKRQAPFDVEVCLDVSAAPLAQGELVYTHRRQAFFMPAQQPGLLSIVHRGPTVGRFVRYLNHTVGRARVERLSLHLAASR